MPKRLNAARAIADAQTATPTQPFTSLREITEKLVKYYVRKAEVESFSRLVNLAAAERKARRRTLNKNLEMLREFRVSLQETQSVISMMRGNQRNDSEEKNPQS